MVSILVASVSDNSGKSLVCLGLGLKFKKDGLRVGYFKPIGPLPCREDGVLVDEDAVCFKKTLKLEEPLPTICPLVLNDEAITARLKGADLHAKPKTLSAFNVVSHGKDVVLACGLGRLSSGTTLGFSQLEFVNATESKVIVIDKCTFLPETLDGFLHISRLLGERLVGVIFNRIPLAKVSYIRDTVVPFLAANGIDLLGVIPVDPVLGAVPVKELVEVLNGRVLCAEANLDELVEHFSIGAMNVDAALKHFHMVPNKAVITGGDRADIQLAALETSTKCLILTGDLYPNDIIIGRAEQAGVPIIVVRTDTAATLDICENLTGHISLHSGKIQRVADVVERELDFPLLYKKAGLKPA